MQGVSKRGLEPGWPSEGLRVKRAIVGRRAGPSTPVPSWKVHDNQLYDGIAAAAAAHLAAGRPALLSARQLAASLWELQDLPIPACLCSQHWPSTLQTSSDISSPLSQADPYLSPRGCGNQQYAKIGTETGRRRVSANKQSAAMRHRLLDKPGGLVTASNLLDGQRHQPFPLFTCDKKGEDKSGQKPTMSSELLKVLGRIQALEEQHSTSLLLTTTLRTELEQARVRVQELELAQKSARRDVESVMKKVSAEKSAWKVKEQEKLHAALQVVKQEVEEERKARRRLEAANRKMTKELMESKRAASKALSELEKEHKARELMEDVCDELAREIGDDRAEAEELKRESQIVREELEEERRMLQLAEVWREERVQIKLGEAKLALEEKSAALDVMRAELEAFLQAANSGDQHSTMEKAQVLRNVITAIHPRGLVSSFPPAETEHGTSPDKDLYTVELSHEEHMSRHGVEDNLLNSSEGSMAEEEAKGWSHAYPTRPDHAGKP